MEQKSPELSARTTRQNAALHLMFEQLATELNGAGLYISNVIRADAPWDKERVKELIWRSTQKKMTGKKSTTQLTTKEIDQVFEVIQKAVGDLGLQIQFPSIESVIQEQQLREKV